MPDPTTEDSTTGRTHRDDSRDRGRSPILLVVAALAVVALGLSVWSLLRPAPTAPSAARESATYDDAQRAEGKTRTCAAFQTVRRGVNVNTNLQAPGGAGDVVGVLSVAANARLALLGGGQYLLDRLDPAAPQELADAARSFGTTLMDIGAAATAGAVNTDPEQAARLRDAAAVDTRIAALCG